MEHIEWSYDLSVGIAHIDAQHKHIVGMLRTLGDAVDTGQGREVIIEVVGKMKAYAQYHFATEEEAMSRFDYPRLVSHRAEHDAFIEKVLDVEAAQEEGKSITPLEIWTFLREWVANHISQCDKDYGPFLTERGMT